MTEPSALTRRLQGAVPRDAGPLLFIALVWFVQVRVLYAYVSASTVDIPFADEWEMIPVLTGRAKITLSWLWSQHNEHRIPLPRLLYIAIEKLCSLDFRAGSFFNVAVLSALAAGCCVAVRRVRGAATYADAFFPLLLLHCGQAENLTWSFQIVFVLSTALVLVALMLLVAPGPLRFYPALTVGLCTLALPLTGGASLAFVPALACCTLLSGWQLYRARARGGLAILAIGALGLALLALYFMGYQRPAHHPPSPSGTIAARSALQFLVLGFGSGTKTFWDLSGYLVSGLILATLVMLTGLLVSAPSERSRVLRLGLFLGGVACLAGGIGWSRSGVYPNGIFASRYTTLAAPMACVLYMSWAVVPRAQIAAFAQTLLFALAAMLVVPNLREGQADAGALYGGRNAALLDIQAGVPSEEIARRHCGFLYLCGGDVLLQRMRMLREAKVGIFTTLRD